jgi:hypothetical protein
MATTQLSLTDATYPVHDVDPREKGYDFILQYTRAAYSDSRGFMPFTTVNIPGALKMYEIRMYGMGKQSVDKYKKMVTPGEGTDESWRAVDWTVPAFLSKYREIGIAKILQRRFDIQAFAIDPLAKSEEDAVFNEWKIKLTMRESIEKAGLNVDDFPQLKPQPGEPEDLEQLEMMREFGYKHIMAMEAENAVNLIHQQNDFEEKRKRTATNLYDFGIGAYTQWIDENGMVKERDIDPEYLGLSYCEKPDFSDLVHWFEIVPTYIADLAPYYTKEQLDKICEMSMGKNGNPTQYVPFNGYFNRSWMRFKVFVCKIKFLSWNETVYKEETDNIGNMRFRKTKFSDRQYMSISSNGQLVDETPKEASDYYASIDETGERGASTPKYMKDVTKVVYKGSWIVGTDYMHDYGLQENQNRKLSSWWDTDLGIQIYSWNFYKMQFTGITERLIPFEDKACMAWFNLQNLANQLIPYLINIDMNAVESAGFGKGGKKMQPSEVVNFIFSKFVVPYRSTDLLSRNPNYKPVSIEATGQLAAFAQLYDDLERTLYLMQQISGLNELTDGSTPNAKTLIPVAEAAVQSTNNALYLISSADRWLIERSADAIVQKVQIAVKLGKVEGYAKALGKNAVEFFKINPDISLHELGIFLEDLPTDAQREQLWMKVNSKEQQGFLTIADEIFILKCRNLTQAAQVMDYKIKKRKEEAHLQQMQLVQEQAKGNEQVAVATSQAKQEELMLQSELKIQEIIVEKEYEFRIEQMKKQSDLQGEMYQTEGRNIGNAIQAEAKVVAAEIVAEAAKAKAKAAKKKPAN